MCDYCCVAGWGGASQFGVYPGQGSVPPERAGQRRWQSTGQLFSFFLFFCHMMHQNLNFLPQNSGYCGIIKKKKTEPKNPDRHRVCASRNFVFASLYSSYWVCCYVVYQILTGVVLEHWTTTWYLTWSVITNRLSDVTRRKRELFPSAAQTVWEQRFFKLLYNFH